MRKENILYKEKPDLIEINKRISELYEYVLYDKSNKLKIIYISKVDSTLSDKIFNATKMKLKGYKICIDNFSILHTLNKHGNPVKEAKRGQIAVTEQDFYYINNIIDNPDQIIYKGKSSVGNDVLEFGKKINSKYFVLKEVRKITSTKKGKENRLVLATMYIKKITNE